MAYQLINENLELDYSDFRNVIRNSRVMTESNSLNYLQSLEDTSLKQRLEFQKKTTTLIQDLRLSSKPDLLSLFISVSPYTASFCRTLAS